MWITLKKRIEQSLIWGGRGHRKADWPFYRPSSESLLFAFVNTDTVIVIISIINRCTQYQLGQ